FPLNGDPVTGTGDVAWLGDNPGPDDYRIYMGVGPFALQPGDTQEVVLAVVGGLVPEGDHLTSVARLKENMAAIKGAYGPVLRIPRIVKWQVQPDSLLTTVTTRVDLRALDHPSGARLELLPERGAEPPRSFALYDDGQHGDSLAGDGIWGGRFVFDNRRYPTRIDLIYTSGGAEKTFPRLVSDATLRMPPVLKDWRIVHENGRQDKAVNPGEWVVLAFSVENPDARFPVEELIIRKYEQGVVDQEFHLDQGIAPGATVESSRFLIGATAPLKGDSLRIRYDLSFDGHRVRKRLALPLKPWTPPPIWQDTLPVVSLRGMPHITAIVADPYRLTGHSYRIEFYESQNGQTLVYRIVDMITGETRLKDSLPAKEDEAVFPFPVVDGIAYQVRQPGENFREFLVVANAGGALHPPDGAVFFPEFPFRIPSDRQQFTNSTRWLIATPDNVPGSRRLYQYEDFLNQISRQGSSWGEIIPYDFEIRFTARGSYAWKVFPDTLAMWVPFELWNIGVSTPEDTTDDYRLIPYIRDVDDDGMFNLSS
ncbi:MAG: hypothetical protein D6681_07450, partial [Calditrichaeota bacterium]